MTIQRSLKELICELSPQGETFHLSQFYRAALRMVPHLRTVKEPEAQIRGYINRLFEPCGFLERLGKGYYRRIPYEKQFETYDGETCIRCGGEMDCGECIDCQWNEWYSCPRCKYYRDERSLDQGKCPACGVIGLNKP